MDEAMKIVKEFNLQPSVIILYQAGNPLKIEHCLLIWTIDA
jgi:hypothetical protein